MSLCLSGPKNQDLVPATSEEVIQAGSHVTLKCVGNGTVKWIIQHSKNGEIKNDTIVIPNARYNDTRSYRCVDTAPNSTESASVHLFVKGNSAELRIHIAKHRYASFAIYSIYVYILTPS